MQVHKICFIFLFIRELCNFNIFSCKHVTFCILFMEFILFISLFKIITFFAGKIFTKKGKSISSKFKYIEDNVYVTQWDTLSERVSDDHPLWEKNVLLQALLTAFYQSLI